MITECKFNEINLYLLENLNLNFYSMLFFVVGYKFWSFECKFRDYVQIHKYSCVCVCLGVYFNVWASIPMKKSYVN